MHEYTTKFLKQYQNMYDFKLDNYTEKLLQQFQNAYGIQLSCIYDLITPTLLNTFDRWLIEREQQGIEYTLLLDKLGLNFDSFDCIEFGKGQCDSVVKNFNTRIFTPYTEGLEYLNKRVVKIDRYYADEIGIFTTVINGHYYVVSGQTVMTQNVYQKNELKDWDSLHHISNDIIVGAYGSVYDRDKEEKINELKKLRDKLDRKHIEEYNVNRDKYYYVVASKTRNRKK